MLEVRLLSAAERKKVQNKVTKLPHLPNAMKDLSRNIWTPLIIWIPLLSSCPNP